MADTARPGRSNGASHKSAMADTVPALARLPFRLVKGQGNPRPGRDYLEYEDEVTVFATSKQATMEKPPLVEGRPSEQAPVLTLAPVTKRQPRRLYDYQPGYAAALRLLEMYRALEARCVGLEKKADAWDGLEKAREADEKKRGK